MRVGDEVGAVSLNRHHSRVVWESLDVIDAQTGDVLWTVRAQEGGGLYGQLDSFGDSWWGPGLPTEPAWKDRRHVFFNELAPEPDWRVGHQPYLGVLKVLDAATGEVRSLTDEVEELLRGPVGGARNLWSSVGRMSYDGRVIWEGAWYQYLGVVGAGLGYRTAGDSAAERRGRTRPAASTIPRGDGRPAPAL